MIKNPRGMAVAEKKTGTCWRMFPSMPGLDLGGGPRANLVGHIRRGLRQIMTARAVSQVCTTRRCHPTPNSDDNEYFFKLVPKNGIGNRRVPWVPGFGVSLRRFSRVLQIDIDRFVPYVGRNVRGDLPIEAYRKQPVGFGQILFEIGCVVDISLAKLPC
jgi:hypothetical protein